MRRVLVVAVIAIAASNAAYAQAKESTVPYSPVNSEAPLMGPGHTVGSTHARDSVWNGLANGAAVGALVGGVYGRIVEINNRYSGKGATVTGAIIGAGLGAAVGVGIDALLNRKSGTPHRISLSPVLTPDVRAINAQVRF